MTDRFETEKPGAYLVQGHLFFRMPDRSTILCKCIGEPFAGMIVDMWNERAEAASRWDEYTDGGKRIEPYPPS